MPRYRAAVFHKYKEPFKIEELDTPEVRGEQVLIRTAGCGLCHTDLHLWLGELPGFPDRFPIVTGHEPSGYVAAKGDLVPDYIKIGMPVLVQGGHYVEEDIYTLKGDNQLATRGIFMGVHSSYNGCHAEYFIVPSYRYLVNAEGLEDLPAASTLSDAGLTPYRAVKRTISLIKDYAEADDFVIVPGVGGLGSFGVQFVNALAPHLNVIAVDIRDEPLELARRVAKIHTAINARKEDPVEAIKKTVGSRKVMAVVDFVGSERTFSTYIGLLARKGVYTIVGVGGQTASFSIPGVVLSEIVVQGSFWGSIADLRELVSLARRGMVNYRDVVSRRWKLEEINEALDTMNRMLHIGRMIITP